MKQQHLFAEAERDEALERVLDNAGGDWQASAYTMLLRGFQAHPDGAIAETARLWAIGQGLTPPHHHNAWGAIVNQLVRDNRIESAGRLEKSKTAKSHARRQPVWRAVQ